MLSNLFSAFKRKKQEQKACEAFNQNEKQPVVKSPRSIKHKFINNLNYKRSMLQRSQRSKQYIKRFYDKSNSKHKILLKNTRNSSQDQVNSLLENVVPGAKIVKAQWKDNRLNGYVELLYDNGSDFKGIYENGMRTSGFMKYAQANCQYQGEYFGDKFSGYGKLTYYQGRSIEGEWQQSKIVGYAIITYPNKDVYYGPVDNNLYKDGEGHLFFNNGNKYVGMFKAGSLSGVGIYYQNQKPIAKGLWQKGQLKKEMNLQDSLSQFSSIQEMTMEQFENRKNKIPSISQMLKTDWQYQPYIKSKQKGTNFKKQYQSDSQQSQNKLITKDQINQSSL